MMNPILLLLSITLIVYLFQKLDFWSIVIIVVGTLIIQYYFNNDNYF